MHRRSREFKAESFPLEGRCSWRRPSAAILGPAYVEFQGTSSLPSATATTTTAATTSTSTSTSMPPTLPTPTLSTPTTPTTTTATPSEVVGQQDGVATVVLTRNDNRGRLKVQVITDPGSPAVGVNVGAVDQTVTFANGQVSAAATVPILSGAPNPGEVDVNLTITSVDGSRQIISSGPLELRIVASDSTVAPRIVATQGKPDGIVVTFSKPMNPVEASDVNNYAAHWTTIHSKYDSLGLFAVFVPGAWSNGTTSSSGSVRLKSAQYDPATNSVTLIPEQHLSYSALTSITVTQGHPPKTSGQPGQQSNLGPGLTDLEGNPLSNGSTPGKFSASVFKGFSYPPY